MTTTTAHAVPVRESGRWLIWTAGLVVAVGAAVATAHGLYRVALAATVPGPIAWLYPLITDGLALVAYASTTRLSAGGRRYAWAVVVLAAGLSGLAQASHLAIGVATAPVQLRFGVGAWPAIAAAITAHLLYLLAARPAVVRPDAVRAETVRPDNAVPPDRGRSYDAVRPGRPDSVRPDRVRPGGVRPATAVQADRTATDARTEQLSELVSKPPSDSAADGRQSHSGPLSPAAGPHLTDLADRSTAYDAVRREPAVRPDVVHPEPVRPEPVHPVRPDDPGQQPAVRPDPPEVRTTDNGAATARPVEPTVRPVVRQPVRPQRPADEGPDQPAGDRARAAALVFRLEHGALPTVSELMELADVGRGTAGLALKRLRDQPAGERPGLAIVRGPGGEPTGTSR